MVLKRGDTVPDNCGPPGLVGNLITQPLKDTSSSILGSNENKKGKLILHSGDVQQVEDFRICEGTAVEDPYQSDFNAFGTGKILRAYVATDTPTCFGPITFFPPLGMDGDSFSDSNNPVSSIATFGPKVYSFFSTHDDWTKLNYAGQQWRILSQSYPFTSPGSIWLEGPIDSTGYPTGLFLWNPNPGVYLLQFEGLGILSIEPNPDFPDSGPPGPVHIQYRYKLFYSCEGEWYPVPGITPW